VKEHSCVACAMRCTGQCNHVAIFCFAGCTQAVGGAMVATGGSCPQHGACFMDADANMNCAKQRPEEAISDADVAAGSTATSITFVRRNEIAETKTKSVAKSDYVSQWRWPDLAVQLFIHVGCLYGFYLMFTSVKVLTSIWGKSYFSVVCVCVCVKFSRYRPKQALGDPEG
jgi:hypothetical protein